MAAQSPVDPWETARYRVGPLAFTPAVVLKTLGWDTNVFNSVTDPQQDFTFTLAPQADWWLRAGKARLHGLDIVEGVYYATYAKERGINNNHQFTLEVPLNRVRPYAGWSYLNTRDWPGYEIDARARHTEIAARGGAIVRLTSRTYFDFGVRRVTYKFAGDATFQGTFLDEVLSREERTYNGTFRYSLTPLTTLTLSGESMQQRFDKSPERDNNGYRIMPGVEFDPYALISGTAQVGYRKLNMLSAAVPDFSGMVANVNLFYTLLGSARFGVGVSRDIQYRYEFTEPYYLQSGYTVSVTQRLVGSWDTQARAGRYKLSYRQVAGLAATDSGRVDRYETWGAGIGYRLAQGSRVGFNIDYFRRRSPRYDRTYSGLRGGLAVTYGF